MKLEWPAVEGANGYRIERDVDANDGVDNFVIVGGSFVAAPGTSRTLTDLPLAEAIHHKYRVVALSSIGPALATATTPPVSGDLASSITTMIDNTLLDDSLDNVPRAMATAVRYDNVHVLAVGQPGANQGRGIVRVYERFTNGGAWVLVQTLAKQSSLPALKDHFGASVSLSPNGLYLAVGIPGDRRPRPPTERLGVNPTLNAGMSEVEDSGAVEVYHYAGTEWEKHSWFKAINAGPGDAFGTAVAISDEGHLIVGAPNEDSPAASGTYLPASGDAPELRDDPATAVDRGAVYTYANGPSGYSFGGYIKPPIIGNETTLHFGAAIAIDSLARRVAVGAPRASYNGEAAGGVVLYDIAWTPGPPSYPSPIVSFWTLKRDFGPGSGRPLSSTNENPPFSSDAFRGLGGSLSMSQDGNWLAAGYAYGSKAFLYRNLGGTWNEHSRPASTVPIDGDRFGVSVSLVNGQDGLKLLVGADHDGSRHNGLMRASDIARDDFVATPESGAAYYFAGRLDAGQPLVLKARLKAPERMLRQMLGQATAMTRDGTELLLTGEYKGDSSRPAGQAIFFGY
ncbi:hypothetical protein [Hydrogenophaga sp.]|uniref:hypothetical protein n=1 Tax=Hydrogenophaga sp. TaxID=1904254 RepID=UPI002D811616|nr:hypothetical protein [Hydrogenophaga sp.]